MKKFLLITLIIIAGYIIAKPSFALYGSYDEFQNKNQEKEQQTSLTIPAGSFYSVMMGETVSSEFNNNGDIIKILVSLDYTIGNKVLIPKYAMFIGVVTNLEKAQRGRDGLFSIDVIGLVFPDGRKYDVKGYIPASKDNRVFGGNFARRSGHKTVVHRSSCFHRRGVLQLSQNGPRVMGKETKVLSGEIHNVYIKEAVKIE